MSEGDKTQSFSMLSAIKEGVQIFLMALETEVVCGRRKS